MKGCQTLRIGDTVIHTDGKWQVENKYHHRKTLIFDFVSLDREHIHKTLTYAETKLWLAGPKRPTKKMPVAKMHKLLPWISADL